MAAPRDSYERYYIEKLWSWIPEIYRHEDGVALQPDVLRSFIELIGPPAAVARRSTDRLWEDQFGDFADDWALPYIGDLVGTRLVSALNRRGRRADVVHTIFYRRRKGTLTVLEQLIHDITGWDGAVIEAFRRLGRVICVPRAAATWSTGRSTNIPTRRMCARCAGISAATTYRRSTSTCSASLPSRSAS